MMESTLLGIGMLLLCAAILLSGCSAGGGNANNTTAAHTDGNSSAAGNSNIAGGANTSGSSSVEIVNSSRIRSAHINRGLTGSGENITTFSTNDFINVHLLLAYPENWQGGERLHGRIVADQVEGRQSGSVAHENNMDLTPANRPERVNFMLGRRNHPPGTYRIEVYLTTPANSTPQMLVRIPNVRIQ